MKLALAALMLIGTILLNLPWDGPSPPPPVSPLLHTGILVICHRQTLTIYTTWVKGSWYTAPGQTGRSRLDLEECDQ